MIYYTKFLLISELSAIVSLLLWQERIQGQNKRRFSGNRFVQNAKKSCTNETHQNCANSNEADAQSTSSASVSASSRKVNVIESPNATKESIHATGYRFIDIEILSEVFQQVVCKECGESSSLVLEDKKFERKGCASHLRLRCEECGWVFRFILRRM